MEWRQASRQRNESVATIAVWTALEQKAAYNTQKTFASALIVIQKAS